MSSASPPAPEVLLRVLIAALLTSGLAGCGVAHRHVKLFAPEDFVYHDAVEEPAVAVSLVDKEGNGTPLQRPEMTTEDGRTLLRPAVVTDRDTVMLTPMTDDTTVRLWIRSTGFFNRGQFRPIRTVTGTLPRRFANELAFLPLDQALSEPLSLPVRQLGSPFNAYAFNDGDVMLIEAQAGDGPTQRTLLLKRDVGLHLSGFAGLLVTVPTGNEEVVAPILAAGPALGFRTRKASGIGRALDTFELVSSFGIGSTAIAGVSLDTDVTGLFDSALGGGGVRLFGIVTVQGFVNITSFFREALEAPATLAVGLDATGLAGLTRNAGSRVVREYPVSPE